jgi:hypothetical protein
VLAAFVITWTPAPRRLPRSELHRLFATSCNTATSSCQPLHLHKQHKMAAAPVAKELPLDPKYDNYDYPTISPTVQTGHPGHTTAEQDAQIFQLRSALEASGHTKNLDTLTMVSAWC